MTAKDIAKLLLGLNDTSQDAVIEALVAHCEGYLAAQNVAEPYNESLVGVMVAELYNRLEGAGYSSASFNGIAENYLTDWSDNIKRQINQIRRVKFV